MALEGFLLPGELESLVRHVQSHAGDFKTAVKRERRARILLNAGKIRRVIQHRVRSYLPWVLERLGILPFHVARIETMITASNHGDFLQKHADAPYGVFPFRPRLTPMARRVISRILRLKRSRVVSYVYYFHRTPRRFAGGELLLYPTGHQAGRVVFTTKPRVIAPRHNRIVFFPSSTVHEVRTIRCPSREFADSRFTVNGWVSR